MAPFGSTLTALKLSQVFVHGPETDGPHSTLATVPGSRFVLSNRPFWLNELMMISCPIVGVPVPTYAINQNSQTLVPSFVFVADFIGLRCCCHGLISRYIRAEFVGRKLTCQSSPTPTGVMGTVAQPPFGAPRLVDCWRTKLGDGIGQVRITRLST